MTFLHYLKFSLFHFVGLFVLLALLAGGAYISLGLLAVVLFYVLGDGFLGDDLSTPTFNYPAILTVQLWLALPLLVAIVFVAVWQVSPGDAFGFGAWLSTLTGYDLNAAAQASHWGHNLSAIVLTGLMVGTVGTIPAHELTHRTRDKASLAIGRWLLAFSFDTSFSVEHVYGHHRYVATTADPATAPRGRNVYYHILVSTLKGNISAWRIERKRLQRRQLPCLSIHNAVLRGYAMSLVLLVAAYVVGGLIGMAFFVACALWGKALLEVVNYMEHYGIVRHPDSRVQPHHSWNTNRRISSWSLFNLTRHSHHHAKAVLPYHKLEPMQEAPMMISGYLSTLMIALIPPLWHRLMKPRLQDWDERYATEEEKQLVLATNKGLSPTGSRVLKV
ncbi:MAG: alkane 1-monooxygenase [Saccharospirillum sp.]|nr:alkane 1-monooxygenase [Saccharospirillum sp.]